MEIYVFANEARAKRCWWRVRTISQRRVRLRRAESGADAEGRRSLKPLPIFSGPAKAERRKAISLRHLESGWCGCHHVLEGVMHFRHGAVFQLAALAFIEDRLVALAGFGNNCAAEAPVLRPFFP